MTHRRSVLLLAATAVLTLAAVGCSKSEAELKMTSTAQALEKPKVTTADVTLRDFRPTLVSTGTLVPERKAEIRSLVEGRIENLPVDIGTRVRKGQVLYELRASDYRNVVDQADAALARANVVLVDRERERTRIEGLFKEGSATGQMRDQAITGYDEAKAAVKEAEARRAMARQALEDTTGYAPYDGVVTARFHQKGEYANKADPMIELMDLASLDAEMEVPEPYAGQIEAGIEVDVALRSGGQTVKGRVIAVNPKVDLATRTFRVKVRVDNREGSLQAGLFCTGTFRLPEQASRAAVPAAAVTRDEGRSIVWVVDGGKVRSQTVVEAGSFEGWVFVRDGLKGGEKVVVTGAGALHEGADVTVEGEPGTAAAQTPARS